MTTFENTVFRRPIQDPFGFLADFENIPRWNYAHRRDPQRAPRARRLGMIYQQVRPVPSRSKERFEVTAYDLPRRLEI
jgi:hypothetical protein